MQPHSGDADAPLITHLTRVASTAAATLQAMAANDDEATRRAVDRLRQQWSTLQHGDARQLQTRFNRARSVGGAEAIHCGLELLDTCEKLVKAWAAAGFEQALARSDELDEAGWHAALDHLLPLRWNFDCDVLVVHGRLPAPLAAAIQARRQRRTVLIGPAPDAALPPGVVRVLGETSVAAYLAAFKRMLPKRHLSIDLSDGLLDPDAVQRMDGFLGTAIQNQRMNWSTWHLLAPVWRDQAFANLPMAATGPDLNVLGQKLAGRPAIVVSPGPSLSKNIEVLRQAQGRAVLLAPLQTLKRLYREGIRPDFALVLDAVDQTSEPHDFFGEIPDSWLPDLIASNTTHANVLQRFASAQVYFFNAASPLDAMLVNAMRSPWPSLNAGSVAISCFRLAQHWRCSPIVLVGQDLAFTKGNRYADDRVDLAPNLVRELPGYHGGTVSTTPDYFLFHHQFEVLAASYRAQDPALRLFNCTEGGASIGGFEQRPLSEVLQSHVLGLPPLPPLTAPADTAARARRCEEIRVRIQAIRDRAQQGLRQVESCERSARQAHRGASGLNRLATHDTQLRALVDGLLYLMEERAPDLDDALTAWEASEELEDYLRGSARYRAVARELFAQIVSMLDGALVSLPGPALRFPKAHQRLAA